MPHNLAKQDDHFTEEHDKIFVDLFGLDDLTDMRLHRSFKAVSHLMRHLMGDFRKDRQSSTRIRLLMFLVVDRRLGNEDGVAPSTLSDHLGVSRNTVSALLNGLEEQDLIERHLHPEDRRQFLIRITPAGRALAEDRAPVFGRFVTDLFTVFTPEERETLSELLGKLRAHLLAQAEERGIQVSHLESHHHRHSSED